MGIRNFCYTLFMNEITDTVYQTIKAAYLQQIVLPEHKPAK